MSPAIAVALARVRDAGLPRWDDEPLAGAQEPQRRDDAIDDDDGFPSYAEDDSPPFVHGGREASAIGRPSYPDSLVTEVRQAARAFFDAANYMSLVVTTRRRDFTAWGDVPLPLARGIAARNQAVAEQRVPLAIALAPHHGSQGPTPSLGPRFICISQNGSGLHGMWARKHEPCPGVQCVSTQEAGDISLPLNAWPW